MSQSTVYTIGHSTHPIERFVELLRQHGVTALADVRSMPYSRFNPQYSKAALERTLKANGIAYVFLGKELGARSDDPSCYENDKVRYSRIAKTALFHAGIERVKKGVGVHRVALMCAEREPLECHRTLLVSRELEREGVAVTHIHGDGHLETHSDAVTRLLKQVKLPASDLFKSQEELIDEAYAKQEERVAYVDQHRESEASEAAP
jgi:uncharacterized protein (DUF488 family)